MGFLQKGRIVSIDDTTKTGRIETFRKISKSNPPAFEYKVVFEDGKFEWVGRYKVTPVKFTIWCENNSTKEVYSGDKGARGRREARPVIVITSEHRCSVDEAWAKLFAATIDHPVKCRDTNFWIEYGEENADD